MTMDERLIRLESLLGRILDIKRPKKKPAKAQARPPAPPLTELERVQRDFELMREYGGILAEGRIDRQTGTIDWGRWS